MKNTLVLSFPEYAKKAESLAKELTAPFQTIHARRFPDGETHVRIPPAVAEHVILVRSLDNPNDKLIELMLSASTARRLGAKRISLVAPYLCYMRQDIAFTPGEAISQQTIGDWLAHYFDDVITVDPHLHRIKNLGEAVPTRNAISLSAAHLLGKFLAQRFTDVLLVGPDEESEQWVSAAAQPGRFSYEIGRKQRHGDKHVTIDFNFSSMKNKTVVILDDVLSTGHTIARAAELIYTAGAKEVNVAVTHALFCGDAASVVAKAGIKHVFSTDSILHESNCIALAPLLAESVRAL